MPGCCQKIKETVVLLLLNVVLPTVDVYSDFALVLNFYRGSRRNPYCDEEYRAHRISRSERINCYYDDDVPSLNVTYTPHYGWGTMMLLPFLLNYLICWCVWVTTDKRKAYSWIATLISFYPQYVACKIICFIWTDPKKGLQKKKLLERNLIQMETFYEAVPSTLVMCYLLMKAMERRNLETIEIIFDTNDPDSTDSQLFIVAFVTSVITSSLGLAKNLKVGPCRILPEQKKCLGGLLSPQFILIFLSCGLTLVSKGLSLVFVTESCRRSRSTGYAGHVLTTTATIFLPGLLIGLIACCHRGICRTFLAHPSVFLLPVFSHFTFVSNSKVCCGAGADRSISFSPVFTAINVVVSVAGILTHTFTNLSSTCIGTFMIYSLPLCILDLIFTLAAVFPNKCSCCKTRCKTCCCPDGCCCSCCCSSSCCCIPFQFGALRTSSTRTPYILGPGDKRGREVISARTLFYFQFHGYLSNFATGSRTWKSLLVLLKSIQTNLVHR